MTEQTFFIGNTPALLLGDAAPAVYLFIHGKSGSKEEARPFAEIACPHGFQVLGIDLPQHGAAAGQPGFDPFHAVPILQEVMAYAQSRWHSISLRANSIGAWFSLLAFAETPLANCLLVSPIVDMRCLIENMMQWANVSEAQLRQAQEIPTSFGETLSWPYYEYTVQHPITQWRTPTAVLYAGQDTMTPRPVIDDFVQHFACRLTVMENGEHWFHTAAQLAVLRAWGEENILPPH